MDTGVEFSKDLGKPEAGDSSTQNVCPPPTGVQWTETWETRHLERHARERAEEANERGQPKLAP